MDKVIVRPVVIGDAGMGILIVSIARKMLEHGTHLLLLHNVHNGCYILSRLTRIFAKGSIVNKIFRIL